MRAWTVLALVYAGLGAAAVALAEALGRPSAFRHPDPWLPLDGATPHVYGIALGVALAAAVIVGTRWSVRRLAGARALHDALRPFARAMGGPAILLLAVTSAVGEELVFRGVLLPWIGLVPQALVFGLLHRVPGAGGWLWTVWAGAMGIALGALYALTGSLWGPVVAHALVNAVNLAFLRDHDPHALERTGPGLLRLPRHGAR
ncbi:MAG: CPBP family intramembrane metalloprotease [Polyangiaceae bacterium]|nr:CPBP family intramembrane metalloprotease [Polyangiaceae bacterium]